MNIQGGKTAVRELLANALDPLYWEFYQLRRIPEAKERLIAARDRKLFTVISQMPVAAEREIALEDASKAIGVTVEAAEGLMAAEDGGLWESLQATYGVDFKKAGAEYLTQHIFNWYSNGGGGRFFRTDDDETGLFYKGRVYQISNNLPFAAHLHGMTGLNFAEVPGKAVLTILGNLAYERGDRVEMANFLHTDLKNDEVYLNLSMLHQKILRLAPGRAPSVIDNGMNEQGVMLKQSTQILGFTYDERADVAEGLRLFENMIMKYTPASRAQRYFLACYALSAVMHGYQTDNGLLHIIGGSGLGKSKVVSRITTLMCGRDLTGRGTGASQVRMATQSPYTVFDNLESDNFNQNFLDILLLMANSAVKPKSKSGSDTEIIFQRMSSLGIITSIEPLPPKPELINRTFVLELDEAFLTDGYAHSAVIHEILQKRDFILSALFKMFCADVLPNVAERSAWAKKLASFHRGHNKERNNEHISTMLVILQGLLKYIPYDSAQPVEKQCQEILRRWIGLQQDYARDTAMESHAIVNMLDGVAAGIKARIREKKGVGAGIQMGGHHLFSSQKDWHGEQLRAEYYWDPEYEHHFYYTDVTSREGGPEDDAPVVFGRYFVLYAPSHKLLDILNRYCKKGATKPPYKNAGALGKRMADDQDTLNRGGWDFVSKADNRIVRNERKKFHYVEIHGQKWWRIERFYKVDVENSGGSEHE